MLTVWGRRNSFNVQKVLWLVAELGLAHRHIPVGGAFGGLNDPAFRAMNPHGRVPVLQDNELTVWESHAILRYLAAKYAAGTAFWREDASSRSQADRWMDWMLASLQPDFLTGVFWGFYRTPEKARNLAAIERSIKACHGHFSVLERQLSNRRFLCSDELGLADIAVGTVLYRYFDLEIERHPCPNVVRWYEALKQRQAYRAHVMVAFGDLYGRLDF